MQLPTTSSSYDSDTDDMYGFDTDDLPPSSDSELVSQPSDNEDAHHSLSDSSSPVHSATYLSGPQHDDDDDNLPSFLLSSQDLNPGHQKRSRRDQDDFYLVEPSDADSMSRPQSSLSRHSDHDRETDSMGLIYPSMTVSSLRQSFPPNEQDTSERLHHSLESLVSPTVINQDSQQHHGEEEEEEENAEELQEIHQSGSFWGEPSFHEAPSAADSSMDTITGIPLQMVDYEVASSSKAQGLADENASLAHTEMEDLFPITGPIALNLAQDSKAAESLPPPPPLPRNPQEQRKPTVVTKSKVINQQLNDPSLDDTVTRRLAQDSPSRKAIIEPCYIGWMIILCFVGSIYLSIRSAPTVFEYLGQSSRPAHALVEEVHYDGRNQLAILRLDVLTADFKRTQWSSRRPSAGFHVRVLSDSLLWSLEEAPERTSDLFSEIFVIELSAGPYEFGAIPLLSQPADPLAQADSDPQGPTRHCTPYPQHYWHVWFANGTRVPGTPIGVFNGKPGQTREWPCFLHISDSGNDRHVDHDENDYLRYWRSQWQQMSGALSTRFFSQTLAKSNINWNKMWLAVCNVMNTALTNTQEGIRAVYEWLIMLVEQFFKTGDWVLERALENLKRAKSSARVVKGRAGHRLEVIADRLAAKMTRKDTDDGGRHPKDGPARQWSKKIKTILKESERKVEEVMQNEFVQGVGQKLHEKLETLQSSPTGQKVGQKLHKKLEKFQSSQTGQKVVQGARAVKKDATRRLSMLKERLTFFT